MKSVLRYILIYSLLSVFAFTILKATAFSINALNEDAIEELVDLTEKDLEEKYNLAFDDSFLLNSGINALGDESLAQYFHCHLLKRYNEPNPKSLFTPPDFI